MPADLIVPLGTAGTITVLSYIVRELWLEHRRADARDRAERDEAIAGWKGQSEATKAVAATNDRALDMLERTVEQLRSSR